MLLEGKKAIITGGTRGIGYAIACRFIEEGATVTVFGSRQETANVARREADSRLSRGRSGVAPRPHLARSRNRVVHPGCRRYGRLDTVVNNAGISQRSPLLDYTAEEFAKVMDLNVVAAVNGHQAAAKIMTGPRRHHHHHEFNGRQVCQLSGVGILRPSLPSTAWSSRSLRQLAPMGIRVNAVAPGVTKTDMVANLPEEVIKPIIATIPLGRMGEPEDVANAFVFLASDMSSYVTGAILPVDGAARS